MKSEHRRARNAIGEAGVMLSTFATKFETTLASILLNADDTLGAQSLEAVPGSGGVVYWCFDHQQELTRCTALGRTCGGEPVSQVTDRTGEAARSSDQCRADEARVLDIARRVRAFADELETIRLRHRPMTKEASDRLLAAYSQLTSQGEPGCCWMDKQIKVYEEMHVRTTFEGYLVPAWPEARPVCRWVYRFVREGVKDPKTNERVHRLPTAAECRQYQERGYVQRHHTELDLHPIDQDEADHPRFMDDGKDIDERLNPAVHNRPA